MASIKKINDRKFKITISNGYRANGSKISKAKTIDVPKTVQSRSIMQYVNHIAEEFEREVKLGYSEDSEMTFEQFALGWLNRQTKYAINTLNNYKRSLEYCYPYIGSIKLNRLRPIAIENMLIELRKRTYYGKPIKEVSVQKHLIAVSAVLADAKRNEIITKNPASMVKLPPIEKTQQVIPTDNEIKRFFKILNNVPIDFRVYYMLAIFTGCRRGELCGLKWEDIIIVNNMKILLIRRSRSSLPYSGVIEKGTKNNREREIVLNKEIRLMLSSYKSYKEKQAKKLRIQMSEYIFTNNKGVPMHPDTYSKKMRKIFDKYGFSKDFHLHTLRHYFVSTMLHNGVDKQTVADLVGHGDTSYLERTYCHPHILSKHRATCGMSNMLFGTNITINDNGIECTSLRNKHIG